MKSNTTRAAIGTLTAGLCVAATMAVAGPAQAADTSHCKTTSKSFNLPGKPDVQVGLNICISYTGTSGGYRYYRAWLSKASWNGTSFYTGGTRFNSFSVWMRAEHGSSQLNTCYDDICETNELATAINGKESGSKTFSNGSAGYGVVYVKTKSKTWTADGFATYDIANDGKSEKTLQLNGTAAVS